MGAVAQRGAPGWRWLGLLLLGGIVGALWAVQTGRLKVPIRYPSVWQYVHVYPGDVLPWHPRPLEGDFSPNRRLNAVRLFEGEMEGSESVIVSPDGVAVMLNKYGGVFEAHEQPDGSFRLNRTARAWLGPGRPLGAGFDAAGNIIVCDALKGILMVEAATNRVVVLTNRVSHSSPLEPDSPIIYANDLDVAADGAVYFTTSVDIILHRNAHHTSRFMHIPSLMGRPGWWDTVKGWGLGMCQGLPGGKLYKYDPATKQTHLLARDLWYSNGVAVSEDGDYVVVSETDRLRLLKFWLRGPKAGSAEIMIDHLPGTPDGLSRAPDGNFWVALLARLPPPAVKYFHWPLVRALLPVIPETWRPDVREWGAVVKVSPGGDVLEFLEDPQRPDHPVGKPSAYRISSAHEHAGRLWLGALVADFVSYVDLGALPPRPAPLPVTWAPPVGCWTPPCARVAPYH